VSDEEAACDGVVFTEEGLFTGVLGAGLAEWLGFFADPVFS
jgi:hypothetical protein